MNVGVIQQSVRIRVSLFDYIVFIRPWPAMDQRPGLSEVQSLQFAQDNRNRYLAELKEFLSIPSISTLSEHRSDIQHAAEWLLQQLRTLSFRNSEIIPTNGHPIVFGEWFNPSNKLTVLIYGHYDVQPADPLEEWDSPPFEPTVRGDDIYARGASDMKGQAHAVLKALEAWLQRGDLPVNIKILFEGEEEIGSRNLGDFIDKYQERLRCDAGLNVDSGIIRPDLPSLVYGLRGTVYLEVSVHGPSSDLHSGLFGGIVHNPAHVLCELLAGLHDREGRVTLPGFYDNVRVLTDKEREELAHIPQSDEEWVRMAGVPQLYGERGFTTIERLGARPTLDVNGLLSGFTGQGAKTVIPPRAMAKVSMRLVPYQNNDAVIDEFKKYIHNNTPATVKSEANVLQSGPYALIDRETPSMRAASAALEATFGVKPVFRLEGGSVPVVTLIKDKLGVDSVLMGFGLPDDNIHAPNEKLHLPTYYRGIDAYIRFFGLIADQAKQRYDT